LSPPAFDPQIIKAVNLDSEKLQRRDGEDGCRQFWSAYQQLQTGLLDVATAHATFAMKLHAHVMEPLKECGEQSEQVCAVSSRLLLLPFQRHAALRMCVASV
jgi:hypothetical protein